MFAFRPLPPLFTASYRVREPAFAYLTDTKECSIAPPLEPLWNPFGRGIFLEASTPLIVNDLTYERPQKYEVLKMIFRL